MDQTSDSGNGQSGSPRRLAGLSLIALGVVYGDIGTSPLYALRQCFFGTGSVAPTPGTVLGILSLIFWALILIISLKYLLLIMRADNEGEGGILALLALLDPWRDPSRPSAAVLIVMGLFGAALLYGDGMITPAISVLSAVEGLRVTTHGMARYVLPLTVVILLLLFIFQRRGTGRVGAVFGPVMLVWFTVLALLGLHGIIAEPAVLWALNPVHAIEFLRGNGSTGFFVLGAVFLAVTGGEALYADMGHFGRAPIRLAWFGLVLPALVINYFGQGAYILGHPSDAIHPFYNLAPQWARYPLIALATIATVIASQAVISGAFSLTRQAVQLGQSPRVHIVQTSHEEMGQIYVPVVNWLLMIAAIGLVLGFGSSSRLAAAYGVAVSTTMLLTTLLAFFVMRARWHWPVTLALPITVALLLIDTTFLGANLAKIPDGGWFPLAVAGAVYFTMQTWSRGRMLLARLAGQTMPLEDFVRSLALEPPIRVPGSAVFLTSQGRYAPRVLLHHLKHTHSLHERVILATVMTEDVPRVPTAQRLQIETLDQGFHWIILHYGFMQSPNIPVALRLCADFELLPDLNVDEVVYYVGRATLIPSDKVPGMALWRERFFAFMSRNALNVSAFYGIPPERVVELGIQIEI